MNSAGTRPLSASEIAALTGGRLVGPGTVTVAGIAPLERAGLGDLSFLASPRYAPYFERTSASVVLVAPALESTNGGPETRIVVADPYAALLVVLPVLYPQAVWEAGVHPTAVIGHRATWQEPVAIGPHAVLGREVQLGRNVRIGAGCVLGDGVAVGDDTQLYPGGPLYSRAAPRQRRVRDGGRVVGRRGLGYDPRAAARPVRAYRRCSPRRHAVRLSGAAAPRVLACAGSDVPAREDRRRARGAREPQTRDANCRHRALGAPSPVPPRCAARDYTPVPPRRPHSCRRRRDRESCSGGPISPASPRFQRASPKSKRSSVAPRSATARPRFIPSSICSRQSRRI